jgi:transketolase C-terminal domain/subunit
VHSIGIPDQFVEQGTQALLRAKYGLDPLGIVKQVLEFFPELIGSRLHTLQP